MRFLAKIGPLAALFLFMSSALSFGNVIQSNTGSLFLTQPALSLNQNVLGSICFASPSYGAEPPCNPAFSSLTLKKTFVGSIWFGDDYSTLYRNRDLLGGKDTLKLVDVLTSEKEPLRFEGSANFWYSAPNFSLSYTPMRLTYFSLSHNPAYPELALQATQEQSVSAQGGFETQNAYFGLRARYVRRQFISQQFYLLDAVADPDSYLGVKTQNSLFLEPGVAYSYEGSWAPTFSVMMSNVGFQDSTQESFPNTPTFDFGYSMKVPIDVGAWTLGVNYRRNSHWSSTNVIRLGTQYSYGMISISGGWDETSGDVGVNSQLGSVSCGIAYKRMKYDLFSGDPFYDNAVYVELKYVL